MTKRILIILSLLVVLSLAGCDAFGSGGGAGILSGGDAAGDPHTISVSGRASVSLVPDLAEISIGVQTEGETAALAVADNNLFMDNVIASLEAFGVESNDIQTSRFNIHSVQNRNNQGLVVGTTFRVQNSLSVTVRALDELGAILDAVVAAGANTINSISFKPEDAAEQAARDQALTAALADARRKADLLAEAAGVEIIDVITINVNASGTPFPPVELRAADGRALGGEVPVSPGESELTVEVYVVYQIAAADNPPPTASPQEQEEE